MRAAMALAVVSVSTAAFGQVLTLGGTTAFTGGAAPYAKMGGNSWEMYLKHNTFGMGPLPAVVGSNVAGNGTQAKFANQYLGMSSGMNGANGQVAISPTIPASGYAAGAYQTSNLFYLKTAIAQNTAAWGTSGLDANGHYQFDFRFGFVQDAAGYTNNGNTPSAGKQMDPSENKGTKGIFVHLNPSNTGATTLGQPGNAWAGSASEVGFMSVGAVTNVGGYPVVRTGINSALPSTDMGVAYDSALEVSGKMFADPVNAGMVIAQVKMGKQINEFSFDPTDTRFGGTFDWANAKPIIYMGSGGWTTPVNDHTVGIMSAGDANVDGNVDLSDLAILAGNWQGVDKAFSTGDFSQDGLVDLSDLAILAGQWNTTVNSMSFEQAVQSFPQLTAVPEPASLGFLSLGALALLRRRRA